MRPATTSLAVALLLVGLDSTHAEWSFIGLGTLGGSSSYPGAISADGLVLVGDSENVWGAMEAFRWTEADGVTGLETLGGPGSYATHLSLMVQWLLEIA